MDRLIFVVDDSRTVRASVEYTLQKAGYTVKSAKDGKEGLSLLNELLSQGEKPSMIITDINMPEMNGIDFLHNVKKDPKLKFIPVLVLTTESEEEMKMKGKEEGAAGWLVKPFNPDQLVGVVRKFVK